MDIKNKYEDIEAKQISIYNSQHNPYNIKRDKLDVTTAIDYLNLARQGLEEWDPDRVDKWISIARLNGEYVFDTSGKADPTKLLAYLMDYLDKINAMGE